MTQHSGTDCKRGLVGMPLIQTISRCSADVTIRTNAKLPYGVDSIGGLVGLSNNTVINNVYALSNIDYSFAEGAVCLKM